MVNGNAVNFQVGKESIYGTSVVPTNKIEISSEGFKYVANKTEEGLLTGRIGGGLVETMSKKTEGAFSTLAKPSTVGYVLKGVFGKEAVSEQDLESQKYTHTFTPVGNKDSDKLPSYTFTIDRGMTSPFTYTGVVMDSVSFNAAAEDRLKLDVTCIGKEESTGAVQEIPSVGAERSFKFHQGKVMIGAEKIADVTSIGVEYKNNCESFQSTDTGYFFSQPVQGKRECTATLETLYTNKIEQMRIEKFKTDEVVAVEVSFKDDKNNELIFTIPNAQIQAMDNPTASGAETLKQSITVQAVDISDTFVKVELKNDVQLEY